MTREWNLNWPWRLAIGVGALAYLLLAQPWHVPDASLATGIYIPALRPSSSSRLFPSAQKFGWFYAPRWLCRCLRTS
jgi:hypothetical protein